MTPRTKAALVGGALILATNAVAVGGALYNRGGAPESQLALTDRELDLPYRWEMTEENSGLSLRINWRSASPDDDDSPFAYHAGPSWLDERKLAELGFDVSLPPDGEDAARYYDRQRAREAFLVLELDGPAYAAAVRRAERRLQEAEAKAADHSGESHRDEVERAQKSLERERESNSRLFIVDAATDAAALRERYPDRSRYAIVRGHVEVDVCETKKDPRLCGRIDDLEVPRINVPLELRPTFDGLKWSNRFNRDEPRVPYTTVVAFGRRLEPWLVSAQRN